MLLPDKNFSHLSGAVSMDAGVGGLALAAAVAPRAVTSLGLGGDGGHCDKKSGLRRRIVQMLKNVSRIWACGADLDECLENFDSWSRV